MTAAKKKTTAKTETAQKTTAPKAPKSANANEKKSSLKLIIGGILGFVLMVGLVLFLNMGSLAKTAIEKIASDTLGVPVTLATLDIKLAEKTITVTGLNVTSPKGFKKPSVIKVGRINIAAESLSPELLVFKQIAVEGTNINLEVTEQATNITTIRNNVDSKAAAKPASADQKAPPKVIIRELLFNGMKLNPSMTMAGGDLKPVEISNLRMTNIGDKQQGVLASEAIAVILETITKTSMQASMQAGFLQGMSTDALGDIKNQLGMPANFKEQAKQGIDNLTSGIKGLFGGAQ